VPNLPNSEEAHCLDQSGGHAGRARIRARQRFQEKSRRPMSEKKKFGRPYRPRNAGQPPSSKGQGVRDWLPAPCRPHFSRPRRQASFAPTDDHDEPNRKQEKTGAILRRRSLAAGSIPAKGAGALPTTAKRMTHIASGPFPGGGGMAGENSEQHFTDQPPAQRAQYR